MLLAGANVGPTPVHPGQETVKCRLFKGKETLIIFRAPGVSFCLETQQR